jgi:hypothetical protein
MKAGKAGIYVAARIRCVEVQDTTKRMPIEVYELRFDRFIALKLPGEARGIARSGVQLQRNDPIVYGDEGRIFAI